MAGALDALIFGAADILQQAIIEYFLKRCTFLLTRDVHFASEFGAEMPVGLLHSGQTLCTI